MNSFFINNIFIKAPIIYKNKVKILILNKLFQKLNYKKLILCFYYLINSKLFYSLK